MENIKIKKLNIKDLYQLQQISIQTFSETFAHLNSEENMKKYFDEALTIKKLSAEMENKNSEFYFAMLNEQIMGYLKLNFSDAQMELQDDQALEIERIYVLKDFQGKSVGQKLYELAIKKAKDKNMKYVWLGVWENNERAINFYNKNGFVAFDKHIFRLGEDDQTDIMMKLEL